MKIKRFHGFDVFVLFFVAACAFGVIFRLSGFGVFAEKESLDRYELHFEVKNVSANSEKYFVEGDSLLLSDGVLLGKIKSVDKVTRSAVYAQNANGELVAVSYPENTRIDLFGSIETYGVDKGGGFLLGGVRHVASGESFFVSSEHIDVTVKIIDIVKK